MRGRGVPDAALLGGESRPARRQRLPARALTPRPLPGAFVRRAPAGPSVETVIAPEMAYRN
jgi:hypothetical protein